MIDLIVIVLLKFGISELNLALKYDTFGIFSRNYM